MCTGSHPVSSCIVCLILLCNCISLWATPARLSEWPKLQLVGETTHVALDREIHKPSKSSAPQPDHQAENASRSSPHSSPPSSPSSSSSPPGCAGCRSRNQVVSEVSDNGAWSPTMSAAEKDYRVQALKRQILDALDLPAPPIMKGDPPKLTPEFVEKVFGDLEGKDLKDEQDTLDDEYESIHTDKQFILGVGGEAHGYGNDRKAKLTFVIPPNVQRASFVRGKLWISVINSSSATKRSIIVTQRSRRKYYTTHVVAVHRAPIEWGWIGIELSSAWSASEHSMILEVITESVHRAINVSAAPILEVTVMTRVHGDARRRVRRGVNCQSSNPVNCCLQSFSVTMEELSWNWIIQPDEIVVNYCRGSCDSGTNHLYIHSSVMYTRSMSEGNLSLRAQMMPCCTPKRLGPVQLIYYRDLTNVIDVKRIPNLRVLECGCA